MKYNYSADGLRGFAAINVIIAHFIAAFYPTLLHRNYLMFDKPTNTSFVYDCIQFPIISLVYNGHFAVIIFFVLSGYVLGIPAFENNLESIKKRLWGRYLRLNIPVAFILLLSYLFLVSGLYYNVDASEFSGSIKWLSRFYREEISIFALLKMMFYDSIINGNRYLYSPLWTIQIEFVGSIYLLIYFLIKPKNVGLFFEVLLILLIFIGMYVYHKADAIYFYTIFLGAYLYAYKNITQSKIVVFALIGIYFGSFQFEHPMYNFLPELKINNILIFEKKTFYNVIGAICLTLSIVNGFCKFIFSSKIGIFLGRISYSIYLIHFIILCSITSYLYILLPKTIVFSSLNFILYVSLVLIISRYIMHYVDQLAIKTSHDFSKFLLKKNIK
ncbi:MAG: acyltransferase [Campylobacterales bacterium]|nr:acyltransferase [Campylobacterales bacterium]MBN2832924.1 acyltransferase [Campylobacterales bacterium]